ncbi:hypothetical protein HYT25_00485 [Candidatus Pacearchaeota archaeon]|nr:hypothetical protein [Candidatus Pacearchaeota archaeon]
MSRFNENERTLIFRLYNNNPNASEVSRRSLEKIGRKISERGILRFLRRNGIETFQWGKPPRIDDETLEEHFHKYENLDIVQAAKKTAAELGYKTYLTIKRRWGYMGLIH